MLVEAPARAALDLDPAAGARAASGPARAGGRRLVRRLAARTVPYLYLTPALAGFGLWVYRPLVQTVRYSFLRWNLLPQAPRTDVGLDNYRRLLHLPALHQAIGVTGIYIAGMVAFGVVVPLLIGLATQRLPGRSRSVYRAILFIPVLVSPVVAATIFDFLLAPRGGLVNSLLGDAGVGGVNWLASAGTARASIVMIGGWKVLGLSVLVVSAGLASINAEYYEAAAVDGASRLRTFRELTLPLLSPTLLFLVVVAVLMSSQVIFPLLSALTQGGPGTATSDIYYLLYTYGFSSFDVGLASAAAVLFFVAFAAVALACVTLMDRWGFYDS